MNAEARLLDNYEEIEAYNDIIEQHGKEEAFNLGLYTTPPKERYVKSEFLFRLKEVDNAWIVEGDFINMKMDDGSIWTIYYTDELWNKLKKHFKE
jgi:hypothetical protein